MRGLSLKALTAPAALSLIFGLAACGSDKKDDSSSSGKTTSTSQGTPAQGKAGGTLTALASGDVDFIDPGATYYTFGFQVAFATQSSLYGYKPDDSKTQVPQLAASAPVISPDGKTVTVKIKPNVKFSPPVNRVVTSKDVKYAIERGFFKSVANGYAGVYFGDLEGAKVGAKPGTTIKGIETPDDTTIVFHLTRGSGGVLAGALALPLSAPVPPEYAAKHDDKTQSDYGQYQVSTGPYMVKNDASGKATGYQATKSITLVRNPNWVKGQDFRPAYLDEIDIQEGNEDSNVASRKIITGSHTIDADFSPPPEVLKPVYQNNKDQLALVSAGGGRWVSMNTTVKPFDDINVRKAVIAGFNRNAMRLTRGGPLIGDIPTHFIPPGVPGFDEAGGMQGPGLDFLANPNGDQAVSAKYFKAAGFASGKYEGKDTLLMVGTSGGIAQKSAEVAKQNFENMGFKVQIRLVTQDAMYTKYCNVPRAKVAICPNVGWFKDFQDGQTMLDPTFNGKNILPENNSNWPQLNDPAVNAAMAKAETLTDPAARAQAWGAIDKQVTALAPVVPWIWDKTALIHSKDVNAVPDEFNAEWSLSFTSLK